MCLINYFQQTYYNHKIGRHTSQNFYINMMQIVYSLLCVLSTIYKIILNIYSSRAVISRYLIYHDSMAVPQYSRVVRYNMVESEQVEVENFHPVDVYNIYTNQGPFLMHVTRNLCDRQRETGNPKRRKFPSSSWPRIERAWGARSCLSSSTNVNSFLLLVNVSFDEPLRLYFRQLAGSGS